MLRPMIASLAVLMMAAAPALEAAELETLAQKGGYALGANIGSSLKRDGADIDAGTFIEGFKAAYDGAELTMTPDEMQNAMKEFQDAMQAKMTAQRESAGKDNQVASDNYMKANAAREGITTLPSGLQYEVLEEGSGKKPAATDEVTVHYTGKLIDGTVFDSSEQRGQPATFKLNQVIPGWTEGLQLMSEGAKYRLYIPPKIGYGERGAGASIGPNAALVFDVHLIKIN